MLRTFLVIVVLTVSLVGNHSFAKRPVKKQTVAVGELKWAVSLTGNSMITSQRRAKEVMAGLRGMVNTALVRSKKFEVIERTDLDQIVEELDLIHDSGLVDPDSLEKTPEWGRLKGVNWLVLGVVTQFSMNRSTGGIAGVGSTDSTDMLMVVDLRLIDVESGTVKDAVPLEVTVNLSRDIQTSKVKNGKVKNNKGKAQQVSKLMRSTADLLVRRVATNIIPIKVIGVNDDEVILNYGSGLLKTDDFLVIYTKGAVYVDPDTGEEEAELIAGGRLRVYQTQKSFSKAVPYNKKTKIKQLKKGDICSFGKPPQKKQSKTQRWLKKVTSWGNKSN